jgi:hypothetical protein
MIDEIKYWQHLIDVDSTVRKRIREIANCGCIRKVYAISGSSKPEEKGTNGYWVTIPGNTVIRYPNAYRYKKRYVKSTKRIEVGVMFLKKEFEIQKTF